MTAVAGAVPAHRMRGPMTARWFARTAAVVLVVWVVAGAGPALAGLSLPWRAFGAGLIVPGAGLVVAVPPLHHPFDTAMVVGHAVIVAAEAAVLGWALRRFRVGVAVAGVVVPVALIIGVLVAPGAVVVTGHIAGFAGVLAASGWAFAFRCIARSDYVTLPVIVLAAATAGAGLAAYHGAMPGPFTWFSWAALGVAVTGAGAAMTRDLIRHRAAVALGAERARYLAERRVAARTNPVPLQRSTTTPPVTEASTDQLALLRHLLRIALRPPGDWSGFDGEGPGPLQQYRYQVNALGWALSMYAYSHTPALRGPVHAAQSMLLDRLRDPAVWRYWYWENLLGNWDFRRRRTDPIDVRQNIMFTGYLNLQLGMFEQATGDTRFRVPGALEFPSPSGFSAAYDHDAINAIVVRNFDSDLCLWPCEPLPIGRSRTRGLVFPYCNAVSVAGVAVADALRGSAAAAEIAPRLRQALETEFTAADGDLVTFLASGLGLTARGFRGPTTTAGIVAFLAPLLPETAWRAWEVLRREWLESGQYLLPGTGGSESPTAADWGSQAATNAEPLAAAMLLAQETDARDWHSSLWRAATDQLRFGDRENPAGARGFMEASVHANGMLGLGSLGRPRALTDMMSRPRPAAWDHGPRIAELPHPDVLVARAVGDGIGLDAVFRAGVAPGRYAVVLDRLRPARPYYAHGATESVIHADAHGAARITIDLHDRTVIELRPA
ncbi:hypothetical protein [Nocardia wallacei]|uniref:Linalool dehydratase/isomerase domain-containing protein n=1 Tax=Nocardia wallacei TaxID=480035 RepID=A0A7G1KNP1_9NOCA|nr:hypothetical protein [Nocardia wallacei]BCK54884.1 hypothetical protein NWFMUON74_26560 [Nocardia wallacei]